MQVLTDASIDDKRYAYLLLRVLTGFDFFGHGFARIFTGTHLGGFAHAMAAGFSHTPMPYGLALASGYVIPCVELLVGVLLLIGVATRFSLLLAGALMFVLMFGVTLKQDWATAGSQLVYGLVLAVLLFARVPYDLAWPQFLRTASSRAR